MEENTINGIGEQHDTEDCTHPQIITSEARETEALRLEHLRMLRESSGISNAVILARGYRTITNVQELQALGFSSRQLRQPGLLLPRYATDGRSPGVDAIIAMELQTVTGVRQQGRVWTR